MQPRQLRAAGIVKAGGIKKKGRHLWIVPSQTHAGTYVVDTRGESPTCTCPDYESRSAFCKHIFATLILSRRLKIPKGLVVERPKYSQDWPNYNLAQQREKEHVVQLLRALCDGITMPEQSGRGRPKVPLSDAVFAMTMKVYTTISGRRASTDIRECEARGLLDKALHYNTISKYFTEPTVTPLLRALIRESASPLADIEQTFAVDATGFSTGMYDRWYDAKWGKERKRALWLKGHAICGTLTHVVTDIIVTDGNAGDAPELPELVKHTGDLFEVREVSADKAYLSRKNLMAIADLGAMPYIPFKEGTKGNKGPEIWRRMYHYFQYKADDFMAHYHRRSNVETVFAMIKRKFGTSVRSKSRVAQENEILCKFLCHNLCVLVSSIYELGIVPEFWAPAKEA